MNINKYVDFARIWTEEVDTENIADYADNKATIKTVTMIRKDSRVKLRHSECSVEKDKIILVFSERGGEDENAGWSRDYTLYLDSEFTITFAMYAVTDIGRRRRNVSI